MRTVQLCAATAFTFLAASGALAAGNLSLSPAIEGVGGTEIVPVHSTCHQNHRTHGGAYPNHFHNQNNCNMVIGGGGGGGGGQDCHANVQRHFVPGYGSVWHRHRGNQCFVDVYPNQGGPVPGVGGCIQVGPLVVCQ